MKNIHQATHQILVELCHFSFHTGNQSLQCMCNIWPLQQLVTTPLLHHQQAWSATTHCFFVIAVHVTRVFFWISLRSFWASWDHWLHLNLLYSCNLHLISLLIKTVGRRQSQNALNTIMSTWESDLSGGTVMNHSHDLWPSVLTYANNPSPTLSQVSNAKHNNPEKYKHWLLLNSPRLPSIALTSPCHKRIQLWPLSSLPIISFSPPCPCSSYFLTLYHHYHASSPVTDFFFSTHINTPCIYQ